MAKKTEKKYKLAIPKFVQPIVNTVKKAVTPYVKAIQNSAPVKAVGKALPQIVSPAHKSVSTGNKKLPVTPKTVRPAKSAPVKGQKSLKKEIKGSVCSNIKPVESGNAAQVNLQNKENNNIKIAWEENFLKYYDGVLKGDTHCGALRLLSFMPNSTMKQYDSALRLAKIISLGAEVTGAKSYYNKATESINRNFNDIGNQIYNSKTPFASNFAGAFTNSSDYKKKGPLPLENNMENQLLAGVNYLFYSKIGGGILNHADPVTTYNSIKNNTNMASVLGANTGGFFINGAAKMVDGMANICLDPYGTIEGMLHMVTNPKETVQAVKKGVEALSINMAIDADPQEKARLKGKVLFDIASIICLSKIGKASEGTNALQKGAQGAKEAGGLGKSGVSISRTEAELGNTSRAAGGAAEKGLAEGSGKPKWWHEGYVDNLSDTQTLLGVKDSGKGLSTIGSTTRNNALSAGKSWVGDSYKEILGANGEIIGYSSTDGMRAFRIQYKLKEGMWRANFQENIMVRNPQPNPGWHTSQLKNVHVDILD